MTPHASKAHGLRRHALPLIVLAEFMGVSLWFSVNGVADDLMRAWSLQAADLGTLTNAVQLGFIVGTLGFSLSGWADRYTASRLFAASAAMGALLNAAFAWGAQGLFDGLVLRFGVGLCLAGVYPLGMKLVVGWAPERAGLVLAWLVGMLTLGTALPHGVRAWGLAPSWPMAISVSSALALAGAALVLWLGDGPHARPPGQAPILRLGQVFSSLRIPAYRASALGYFGHQWELYAFWTLVPTLLWQLGLAGAGSTSLAWLAFAVVGVGALGCVSGGYWSQRVGSARVAATALALSAFCCTLYPWAANWAVWVQVALMLLWGASVVADSPHFSALSARACPPHSVGSALAFQNALGFAVTMVSIQWATSWVEAWGLHIAWLLLPGPLLGLWGLAPLWRRPR